MNDIANITLILLVLVGLAGTLLPNLPGAGIILFAALLHALLTGFVPLSWQFLLILSIICLSTYLGQYLITCAAGKKMGASKSGLLGACLGILAGIFLPIPGGIFVGAFIGAVSFEIIFDLKELRQAMRAGVGALLGALASLFFEFTVGLIMAAMIFYRLYRNGG